MHLCVLKDWELELDYLVYNSGLASYISIDGIVHGTQRVVLSNKQAMQAIPGILVGT